LRHEFVDLAGSLEGMKWRGGRCRINSNEPLQLYETRDNLWDIKAFLLRVRSHGESLAFRDRKPLAPLGQRNPDDQLSSKRDD
jgi:hypothetical protein